MASLHPVIAAELAASIGKTPYYKLPIKIAREQAKRGYALRAPEVELDQIQDIQIPTLGGLMSVRLYRPKKSLNSDCILPIVAFFHGSGFTILDLDTHDDICRRLCQGSGLIVASLSYRLAPEHPYPAAIDDGMDAVRWLRDHAIQIGVDADRLVLAGDSAGACLAAATALRMRDEGLEQAAALVMWYPVTDHPSTGWASYREFSLGYGLTAEGMRWFWSQYLGGDNVAEQRWAAPLRAATLQGFPSTWIVTAEFDVLRDEGEAFARRLQEAEVDVVISRSSGMNHGFLKYAGVIDEATQGMTQACQWLRQSLSLGQ